jgi:diguanylate cyclase (GGDEF)-like protein
MLHGAEAPLLSPGRDHIICVDDEEGILTALRQQLVEFEDQCEIELARSAQEALDLLDELEREAEPVAMVIADQIMPGTKGVELLEEVHRRQPDTVKILLTGQAGINAIVQAINSAGLNRFIAKPWDEHDLRLTVAQLLTKYRLARQNRLLLADLHRKNEELRRLNQELEARVRARTAELAEANRRLSQLAITDGLTGLYNHRHLHERLSKEVARSTRSHLPLSMLMIDVDLFKRYNDLHGHPAGDAVLRQVAQILAEGRRVNDAVARYGGEEFAVLLIDTPRTAALGVAEQLRAKVAAHDFAHGGDLPDQRLTISIGVATCPDDAATPAELVQAADDALYAAKDAGRDAVRSATPTPAEEPGP